MTYVIPLQGTFYVPPQYRALVAKIAPISGDFAAGVRDHRLTYAVGVAAPAEAVAQRYDPDA